MTILPSELGILIYWIHEREAIRRRRELRFAKPWTSDALLRDYRWCNVRRMDDRVSVELMRQWYVDADPHTQLVAATLGRLVNWPAALLDATQGRPFTLADLPRMRPALQARANRGAKVFTGAYVIPGVPGRNKVDSILELVERVSDAAGSIASRSTLRATWEALLEQDGIGSFLAGQIVADLAHLAAGAGWPDRLSWAPVGPGSARGMNRLRGRRKEQAVPQEQFGRELVEYIAVAEPRVRGLMASRPLCAQDWQGTLCEFDKYRRLQLGEGKVRARYDGASSGSLFD